MANIKVDFIPFYPAAFNPSTQRVQWFDQVPPTMHFEPKFVWVMTKGADTIQYLIDRGVTHFKDGDGAPPERTYDAVRKTSEMFSTGDSGINEWVHPAGATGAGAVWPFVWNRKWFNTPSNAIEPMSAAEGTIRGQWYSKEKTLYVFENAEGDHAISSHWPFVKSWAESFHAGLSARWPGREVFTAWNYYSGIDISIRYSNAANRKAMLHKNISEWPASPFLPGGNLASFTAACLAVYAKAPDDVAHFGYDIRYQSYIYKKAGKKLLIFPQAMHEFLPNCPQKWNNVPGGTAYFHGKLAISPNIVYTIALFAKIFAGGISGGGWVPFGAGGKNNEPFKVDPQWHDKSKFIWVRDGDGETTTSDSANAPVWGTPETFPRNGFEDYTGFAMSTWDRTFGYVMGGTDHYCRFRVDGGSWHETVNNQADDVCDAYYGDGYQVFARYTGNYVAFDVWNGKATDAQRHKVEWEFMGKTYEGYISGTIPYDCLYTR